VPDQLLPRTSKNIHVAGDLSLSREWCSLEFLPSDSEPLLGAVKAVDSLPVPLRRISSPHAQWWPSMLEGNLEISRIRRQGFELYIVERPETAVTKEIFLFAINRSGGKAFFYSTSE
jgi:hypothetical protein